MPLAAGATSTVTVAADYLVGDVAPSTGNNVGQFGDGQINTLDLLAALRAATAVPGYVPPVCSDLYDALDVYPLDTSTARGGDGIINTLDLLAILRKVSGIDATRPRRVTRSACSASAPESRVAPPHPPAPPSEGYIEMENGAVYLHAVRDLDLLALAFSLGWDSGAALAWTPVVAPGGG